MLYMTRQQLRLLKEIRKTGTYNCFGISNEKLNIIKFLRKEGLLDATCKYTPFPNGSGGISTAETGIVSVTISESGKAYFSALAADRIRFAIPIIMSIFATIISLIALLDSLSLI